MACPGEVRSVPLMQEAILDALGDPATYGADGAVARHETHGSWVFVSDERVLKVKKPVVLEFLDYGTLERRRAMCREEVRLNRRLAPELYRGTVAVVARDDGGVDLDPDDEAPGAIEVAVDMRRYAEADTLAARWAAGTATPAQLRAVGALLAAFHAAEPRPQEAQRALAALRAAVRTTLDDIEERGAPVGALRGVMEAALAARREELLDRGRRGLVVDGHGDLRAEHVLLTDPIQVVDALEFDPGLRVADVACDLGFLVMDVEGAGAGELAAALLEGYREAGGDPGDPTLLSMMACYRALVRAKVDLVRAGQGDEGAAARADARLEQAARLGWRARGPQLLALCGPPATGKSTLARALCAQSDMAHVSSDVARKARAGLAPTQRAPQSAYSREATLVTYRELGRHAAAALAMGRGAVIDATLGDPEARAALRDGLGRAADRLRYVECRVPAAEAQRRARAREDDAARESDATAGVAKQLAAAWAPLDEVAPDHHLALRTDREPVEVIADLTAWLDRRWG
jgi:aminoglycoside phosphotransferase family enzyme/predicted kinase